MGENAAALLVAVIGALGSFSGAYLSNRKSRALIAYRLEELEKRVNRHNNLVERMFALEGRMTETEHRLDRLRE